MPSLGERIVEHLIANGASLDDGELAEALGVQRPAITETCRQLEVEGLVVRNMAGGTRPVAKAAIASAVIGDGPHFWAGGLEEGDEFGGLGLPSRISPEMRRLTWKRRHQPSTTIALVATDAALTKAQAKRLAIVAHGGLHKAVRFALGLLEGDTVFTAATGHRPLQDELTDLTALGAIAADCLARAVARGVYEAKPLPFAGAQPAWRDRFGG